MGGSNEKSEKQLQSGASHKLRKVDAEGIHEHLEQEIAHIDKIESGGTQPLLSRHFANHKCAAKGGPGTARSAPCMPDGQSYKSFRVVAQAVRRQNNPC